MKSEEDGKANSPSASVTVLAVTDPLTFDAAKARKQALFQQFSNELFLESFTYLDRSSLDGMPLVHDRLGAIVEQGMQHLCLRQIERVSLAVIDGVGTSATARDEVPVDNSRMLLPVPELLPHIPPTFYFCRISWRISDYQSQSVGERYIDCGHAAAAHLCAMIRSSRIRHLEILSDYMEVRLCLFPDFFNMLSEVSSTVCVDRLEFTRCSFARIDHHHWHSFLRGYKALMALKISDGYMSGDYVSDESLREYAELGVTDLDISDRSPEARNSPITDEGIVDFLFQETDRKVELTIQNPSITREFALELWEALQASQSENEISAFIVVIGNDDSQFTRQFKELGKNHFEGGVTFTTNGRVMIDFPPTATTWSRMYFAVDNTSEAFRQVIVFQRIRLPAPTDQDQ